MGEFERAKLWLRRALRLARLRGNEIDFANAHRGLGFVLLQQGRFSDAEPHFWKCVRAALRVGRRSLAGTGHHDLLVVAMHQRRWDDALKHAQRAIELYKIGNPRLPDLGHDVGLFWAMRGYYSCALTLFETVLPLMRSRRQRLANHASIAHAAAVVRDNLKFQRSLKRVIELATPDEELAPSSFYQIAEGARCFQDWEQAREFADRALELAHRWKNRTVITMAGKLIELLDDAVPGPRDIVPDEGSVVELSRLLLLDKLTRHQNSIAARLPD